MDEFEITQTLSTHPRFTVFEANSTTLGFPVVLKQCTCTDDAEIEFLVRSALIKAKNKVYSQPLLTIFAEFEADTRKLFVVFVWKKEDTLDLEVEADEVPQFPPGKTGLDKTKAIEKFKGSPVYAKKVMCRALGKEVFCKVLKYANVVDMNAAFKEALALAKCTHPNICDFLDFRLFRTKKNHHCAYIVMEWIEEDLASEIERRKSKHQPYDEAELINILQEVTAGLLHAKSHNLVHRDIQPHNILRGSSGLKVAGFGAVWLKGTYSMTSTATDTEVYTSPEAIENHDNRLWPLESDIFSLGMTMLHLAAMKLPLRTPAMSHHELQELLQREVHSLTVKSSRDC